MNTSYSGQHIFLLQEVVQQCLRGFEDQKDYQHIQLQLADDLVQPLTLIGDDQPLRQIIITLMKAAARFVGATKILVSVKQLLQTGKDVLLEFEVTDNGPSITHSAKASLFTYKRSLAQARSLIIKEGGKSVINSLYGVGTTIKFLLRYTTISKDDSVNKLSILASGLKGKKVLVAEDNELNQKTLAHLLKREGMLVDIAEDGRKAVELMEKNKGYDLMLLDLQLPLMDGFQSAVYIRKKLKINIPIIALTAGLHTNAQARCQEIGIDRYIKKPLKPAELLKNLNYFLVKD
jgi:CheY-like chemotaxis protein